MRILSTHHSGCAFTDGTHSASNDPKLVIKKILRRHGTFQQSLD
jgi:hypothetical protein